MSKVIGILILLGLFYAGKQFAHYWDGVKKKTEAENANGGQPVQHAAPAVLPGLAPNLEPALAAARQRGATGLKSFLELYGAGCADPRRASIELDYILLIKNTNPTEAKRIYHEVKARTPANSPIAPRVKQLAAAYE